jgi:hypothetical protein
MSKRISTNTISKNPTGFTFSIKHKSNQSGTMSSPKIDLSKPVIKHKAISSKKGGRKTYRKKTHGKKHRGKTHKKIRRKTHKKK